MNRILINFISALFIALTLWNCSHRNDVVVTGLEAEFQTSPQSLGVTDPALGGRVESKHPNVYQKT